MKQIFEARKRGAEWWVFCDFYVQEAHKWVAGPFYTEAAAVIAAKEQKRLAREADEDFEWAERQLEKQMHKGSEKGER